MRLVGNNSSHRRFSTSSRRRTKRLTTFPSCPYLLILMLQCPLTNTNISTRLRSSSTLLHLVGCRPVRLGVEKEELPVRMESGSGRGGGGSCWKVILLGSLIEFGVIFFEFLAVSWSSSPLNLHLFALVFYPLLDLTSSTTSADSGL